MSWQSETDAGNDALEKMSKISEIARSLFEAPVSTVPEDFNHPQIAQSDREKKRRDREKLSQLAKEPLKAVILTETDGGDRRLYYFARRAQVDGVNRFFTHTMSPIGSMASYEPGEIFELTNGSELTIISKLMLEPEFDGGTWDSKPAQLLWDVDNFTSIHSLREFIKRGDVVIDGWEKLDQVIDRNTERSKNALRGTGLRDQAILDKMQDEIFRLPLSSQLMISGPPGSGKTTTLIKRIAQKSDIAFLSPDERTVVERASSSGITHSESWIMFTPTELLEGYLSEAFNREGVPAPKDRVWTWSKYSIDVAREEAAILRKSNFKSGFLFDENAEHLSQHCQDDPSEWLCTFEDWLAEQHSAELTTAAEKLVSGNHPDLQGLADQISRFLADAQPKSFFSILVGLASFSEELSIWRKSTSNHWRDHIDRWTDRFGRLEQNNISKLNELVTQIENAATFSETDETTQEEGEEDDFEIDTRPTTPSRKDRIFTVVRQALNSQARALRLKRKPPQKYEDLLSFVGDKILDKKQLADLGKALDGLSSVSRLIRANNVYFTSMSSRYRAFRRLEPHFYTSSELSKDKIDRFELDALILLKLKVLRELLSRIDIDLLFWSSLRPLASRLRNQIYVDEATDFSELQLAAMYHLGHPTMRSFFMSGDFDQRLTEWGIKQFSSLQRAVPGIKMREVAIGYRQSRKLMDFVEVMRRRWLGAEPNSVAPKHGQYDGFEPAIFEAYGDLEAQARWIADRIREIDQKHERLPSIAILVPRSEDVKPLVSRLAGLLESIPVSAHEEAGNLGRDQEVRVFPVQHVKGLEFEAAFFVGVDELQRDVPKLFHRFLYVGSTRAATFLGFAANNKMPSEIMDMRDMFVSSWS